MLYGVGKEMNIELRGVNVDVIKAIHDAMPEAARCVHNPGHGTIWINDRAFNEKNLKRAVHYLLSLWLV